MDSFVLTKEMVMVTMDIDALAFWIAVVKMVAASCCFPLRIPYGGLVFWYVFAIAAALFVVLGIRSHGVNILDEADLLVVGMVGQYDRTVT